MGSTTSVGLFILQSRVVRTSHNHDHLIEVSTQKYII